MRLRNEASNKKYLIKKQNIFLVKKGIEMQAYYFKINKSFFKWGVTLPNERVVDFIFGDEISAGKSREVNIIWKDKSYKTSLRHVHQKNGRGVHQLRWDNKYDLLSELKKEFIQSYIAAFSQEIKVKAANEYHRTKLDGGYQEVVIIKPIAIDRIELETFIKVETPYDELFKRMLDRNVFGWLSSPDKADSFIQDSTGWYDITELKNHKDSIYVVYYLIDEIGRKLYIGSAETLGDRVKPGRSEIPNWNKFRYDIIKPEHHSELRALEYFSIISFARILNNSGNKRTLGISDLTLVNKDYRYYSK